MSENTSGVNLVASIFQGCGCLAIGIFIFFLIVII